MFRENVLTQDDIIDRIASTMVPVAVDRWKAEDPTTREAQFLRPFMKNHPAQGSPCIFAPDGRFLGGFHGYGDMAGRTRKLLDDALKAFGPVKPREAAALETHPYRGKGVMPDGGVSLAAYLRPSDASLAYLNTRTPVVSSVSLTEKEFTALAPRQAVVGERWKLPDAVARRFSRVTSPLCRQHAPEPDWVTGVEIHAEVRAIKDGMAWLHFDGRIASEHQVRAQTISVQATKLTGEGVYDIEATAMRSVLLVGSGTLRWPEAPEKIVAFDVLVEWAREAPEPR
jgi:hypothetical protein